MATLLHRRQADEQSPDPGQPGPQAAGLGLLGPRWCAVVQLRTRSDVPCTLLHGVASGGSGASIRIGIAEGGRLRVAIADGTDDPPAELIWDDPVHGAAAVVGGAAAAGTGRTLLTLQIPADADAPPNPTSGDEILVSGCGAPWDGHHVVDYRASATAIRCHVAGNLLPVAAPAAGTVIRTGRYRKPQGVPDAEAWHVTPPIALVIDRDGDAIAARADGRDLGTMTVPGLFAAEPDADADATYTLGSPDGTDHPEHLPGVVEVYDGTPDAATLAMAELRCHAEITAQDTYDGLPSKVVFRSLPGVRSHEVPLHAITLVVVDDATGRVVSERQNEKTGDRDGVRYGHVAYLFAGDTRQAEDKTYTVFAKVETPRWPGDGDQPAAPGLFACGELATLTRRRWQSEAVASTAAEVEAAAAPGVAVRLAADVGPLDLSGRTGPFCVTPDDPDAERWVAHPSGSCVAAAGLSDAHFRGLRWRPSISGCILEPGHNDLSRVSVFGGVQDGGHLARHGSWFDVLIDGIYRHGDSDNYVAMPSSQSYGIGIQGIIDEGTFVGNNLCHYFRAHPVEDVAFAGNYIASSAWRGPTTVTLRESPQFVALIDNDIGQAALGSDNEAPGARLVRCAVVERCRLWVATATAADGIRLSRVVAGQAAHYGGQADMPEIQVPTPGVVEGCLAGLEPFAAWVPGSTVPASGPRRNALAAGLDTGLPLAAPSLVPRADAPPGWAVLLCGDELRPTGVGHVRCRVLVSADGWATSTEVGGPAPELVWPLPAGTYQARVEATDEAGTVALGPIASFAVAEGGGVPPPPSPLTPPPAPTLVSRTTTTATVAFAPPTGGSGNYEITLQIRVGVADGTPGDPDDPDDPDAGWSDVPDSGASPRTLARLARRTTYSARVRVRDLGGQ